MLQSMKVAVVTKGLSHLQYDDVDEVSFIHSKWAKPLQTADKPEISLVLNMDEIAVVCLELQRR